jgi:pentatricopeptide repeat protein
MLPDGLQSLLAEFDGFEDDEEGSVELQDVATRLLDQLEDRSSSSSRQTNTLNKEMVLTSPVTSEEANAALVIAGEKGSKSSVFSLLGAMETLQIPIYPETITQVMNKFIELKEFLYAEAIFEKSLDIGTNPNSETWSSLIQCKAASGDIASAQVTMDRLIRIGVIPTLSMYHSILRALLDSKQNEKAFDYWMRMKAEGIGLNVESYNLMLQHCLQIYNPERAFLYFDEMKGIGRQIQPNAVSYAKLFEVCGYAPMWVNGYQDIIFDAMAVMEGNEFPPNTEIYNQIIKSFGRAGDSEAAEFYFWEMRQKKIPQTIETYNNLFGALAWYHLPSLPPALSVSLLSQWSACGEWSVHDQAKIRETTRVSG